jgi:hypothetical protein
MRKAAGGQESRRESAQLVAMGGHFSILMNFVGVAVARRRPEVARALDVFTW